MEVVRTKINYILTLIIVLTVVSCNTTEPPPDDQALTLKLEDFSCTEAWIELTTNNLPLPATITLKQTDPTGDTKSHILNLNTKDSLLYIDSLLPNQTYKFQSFIQSINQSSNELNVTTMDTTSHDFTFETFTFGSTAGSSTLYDVAIINENNIWAVGEILVSDTSINGYTTYNAVHWDGRQWELKRIKTNACGGVDYPSIKAIFAFAADDILFAHIDGSISRYNGIDFTNDCSLITQLNGSANKMWGISKNDLYVVSGNGFIAYYNGQSWIRIESGTDLNFYDIYGAIDPKTGEHQIIAICARNYPLGKAIYRIKGNAAAEISSYPIEWETWSVWFVPNRHYYVVGAGIYEKIFLSDSTWKNKPLDITTFFTTSIRGNGINDIIGVGAFGDFVHFNGVSWKNDYEEPLLSNGSYTKVILKGNLIVAVGGNNISINSEAVILVGRR